MRLSLQTLSIGTHMICKTSERGQARFVTLFHGKPSAATLMQTEKAELATGYLEKNVRVTRNRYARPRDFSREAFKASRKKRLEVAQLSRHRIDKLDRWLDVGEHRPRSVQDRHAER